MSHNYVFIDCQNPEIDCELYEGRDFVQSTGKSIGYSVHVLQTYLKTETENFLKYKESEFLSDIVLYLLLLFSFHQSHFFVLFLVFLVTVSLCSLGYPRTHSLYQAGL